LCQVPHHLVAEIIDAQIFTSPRRGLPTRGFDARLFPHRALRRPSRGLAYPGGWWILDEPELHVAQDVLVPDLAGWATRADAARPRRGGRGTGAGLGLRGRFPFNGRVRPRTQANLRPRGGPASLDG